VNNETQNTTEYDINLNKTLEIAFEGSILSEQISNLTSTSLQSGGLTGILRLGVNGQIIAPDDTNDRVLLGKF